MSSVLLFNIDFVTARYMRIEMKLVWKLLRSEYVLAMRIITLVAHNYTVAFCPHDDV